VTTSFKLRKSGKGTVLAECVVVVGRSEVLKDEPEPIRQRVWDVFKGEVEKVGYEKDSGPVLIEAQANFDGEYEYRIVAYVRKMKEAA
jgi:hypothetical protein